MEEKHSVWVGSLSLSAKEDVLSDLFSQFGPVKNVVIMRDEQGKSKQFGYVNFFNREVAECAAHVMDGYLLLRQAIKTKGPRELQKLKAEQNGGVKKDYRSFTDCLFFIDGRDCTWKAGECPFRHCRKAKETENVCEKWLERQCGDLECHNRHPRLTRTGSMINDSTINRCPSHNAFKCFGECGNKDCNTHFLEQLAYLEHVKMSMKKLPKPFATCAKCQAVFFSGPEKINHRCYKHVIKPSHPGIPHFTSTRVPAEKDIIYPVATYSSKPLSDNLPNTSTDIPMHVQPSNHNQVSTKLSTADCPNLDKNYSSTLCDQVDGLQISSELLRKNLASLCEPYEGAAVPYRLLQTTVANSNMKPRTETEPVGVFWDFENCPVPKGKSALAVVQKLRSVFFKDRREVEFMCVCDISKEKKAVIEELNKAQVTVVHINSTSKNAADDKLRQSLRRFAQTYWSPATVILVSGDGNFAVELSDLRHRHNFQIICLHNVAASSALLGFAHETHRFDLLAEDLEVFTPAQVTYKLSSDVLIANLPITKSVTLLKSKLTKLSDNCGGKVLTVSGTKAIIRFPNSEAAFRARRRLDKEELFGSILRATLVPVGNNKDHLTGRRSQHNVEVPCENPKRTTPPKAVAEPSSDCRSSEKVSTKAWNEIKTQARCNLGNHSNPENLKRQNNPPVNGLSHFSRPPLLSPQFHNFPANAMYSNIFHAPVVSSMFHLPTATAPSLHNVNPGILASSGAFSPVGNGAVRRSPSPDQQFTGVDLLVTNINETVSKKEIKKKLASVFREHCKVYSVVLHARNGAPLRAFVKVPKLLDAHLAISKVTGKTILGKVVHVSIATEKDKELCYLQDEVVVVLQEAPLNWLPLRTFLMKFEKKYRRGLDVRHLEQIQGVVVVNGSAGCQTVSLLEGKMDTELVAVDAPSFASDVFKLLHHYEGVMSLASFPALYWLEFHKEIQVSSSGTLLTELLADLPNVMVTEAGAAVSSRSIQWIKPTCSPCDASNLLRLSSQLADVLQKDHEFEMTIEQLHERFFSTFAKPLNASSHGFQSLCDLLHALPAVVEVEGANPGDVVSLTRQHRVKLFANEMEELLLTQQDNTVLLSNFMASYVKCFGHKFKVASFGFSRLTDLIKAIPDVAEIDGIGDHRTVTLVRKKDEASTLKYRLDDLIQDLTVLLNGAKDNEIPVNAVMETYLRHHGRCLSLVRYDCKTLDELIARLAHSFQVVLKNDEKFLKFCGNVTTDSVKKDMMILLRSQENKFIYVKAFPKSYEKFFHRKFPYTIPQLKEILQSMTEHVQIRGKGNDHVVGLFNAGGAEVDLEFLFTRTAVEILYDHPDYTLSKTKFLYFYRQKLQRHKSIVGQEKLLDCVPCCVQVRKVGSEDVASLKQEYCAQILVEQLKELLSSSADMSFLLSELPRRYQKHFWVELNLNLCGLNDLSKLKERFQSFIEVTSSDVNLSNNRLGLSPLSRFEVETQALLRSCDGCLSLNRFAPAYQQMFSKACVVADFGYSKLAFLLNAVPHVARIIGNGPEKVVIAVEMTIPERVSTDLLSVRIINEDNSEVGARREDEKSFPSALCKDALPLEQDESVGLESLPGCVGRPEISSSVSSFKKCAIFNDALSVNNCHASKLPVVSSDNSQFTQGDQLENGVHGFGGLHTRTVELPSPNITLPHSRNKRSSQPSVQESQTPLEDSTLSSKRNDDSASTLSSKRNDDSASTLSSKRNDDSASVSRSTPQKVRLAANFTFSFNT